MGDRLMRQRPPRFCRVCWRDASDRVVWSLNRHGNPSGICVPCFRAHRAAQRKRRYRRETAYREHVKELRRQGYQRNHARELAAARAWKFRRKLRDCGVVA